VDLCADAGLTHDLERSQTSRVQRIKTETWSKVAVRFKATLLLCSLLYEDMKVFSIVSLTLGLAYASAQAQEAEPQFPADQIKKGAALFARHCATCHGTRMRNPQWAINLRAFPRNAQARFVDSVTNGKRNMPPWDDVLDPNDIEALWAYVSAGEPAD
jgi:mono/diheme cytochrome c family protein